MKKTIFISLVLAVILAASMSFGSFATIVDDTELYTYDYIADSYSSTPIGTVQNDFSYHSYNNVIDYEIGVNSMVIANVNSCVRMSSMTVELLKVTYNSTWNFYQNFSSYYTWEEFVKNIIPTFGYTTLDSYTNSSYTTSSYYVNDWQTLNVDRFLRFEVNADAYYKALYSGNLNYSVTFAVENGNTQFHYYY